MQVLRHWRPINSCSPNMPTVDGVPMRLGFVDIKKAYFNCLPKRNVFMRLPREMGLPAHMVGLQIRCVYGTRDAGSIWEETYRQCLEQAGFRCGVSSPCIFHHEERNVSCVVHGDDFTSLSSDAGLDWIEVVLRKSFDIKVRGRLGVGCPGDNELRILNRIVRVTPRGLEYEADPRHVDLMTSSLKLQDSKPVSNPGVKNPQVLLEAEKCQGNDDEGPKDLMELLCALTSDSPGFQAKKVRFPEREPIVHEVVPYSEIYGWLPSSKVSTSQGWKDVSARSCHFTGKSSEVMRARQLRQSSVRNHEYIDLYRSSVLRIVNAPDHESKLVEPSMVSSLLEHVIDDPSFAYEDEDPNVNAAHAEVHSDFMFSAKKGKVAAKFKKRAGAKAVKVFEREVGSADLLSATDATTYRAISARGNYLAQDRPDGSFSSKELCREFSQPNGQSWIKLKMLGRYYKGHPRLVYRYNFASQPAEFVEVFCDTDFAGCAVTPAVDLRRLCDGGRRVRQTLE